MTDAERIFVEEILAWTYWENAKMEGEPCYFRKVAESLSENLIESGEVFLEELYKDDKIKISKLVLSPGAAIKSHPHTEDEEWYYELETLEEVNYCPKGNWHSLSNKSKADDMSIISVKYRN